jgi:hypothetical protein
MENSSTGTMSRKLATCLSNWGSRGEENLDELASFQWKLAVPWSRVKAKWRLDIRPRSL